MLGDFTIRFSDFRKTGIGLKLFNDPFLFEYDKAPVEYQLELIELHSREGLKTFHRENTLLYFIRNCILSKMNSIKFLIYPENYFARGEVHTLASSFFQA